MNLIFVLHTNGMILNVQGNKSGSITSGYPIRGQPSPHVTSGSYQPSTSTPHVSLIIIFIDLLLLIVRCMTCIHNIY